MKCSKEMTWEERAIVLRDIIDDIDTFDDMSWDDLDYREKIRKWVNLSHLVLESLDGQTWQVPESDVAVGRGDGSFVRTAK